MSGINIPKCCCSSCHGCLADNLCLVLNDSGEGGWGSYYGGSYHIVNVMWYDEYPIALTKQLDNSTHCIWIGLCQIYGDYTVMANVELTYDKTTCTYQLIMSMNCVEGYKVLLDISADTNLNWISSGYVHSLTEGTCCPTCGPDTLCAFIPAGETTIGDFIFHWNDLSWDTQNGKAMWKWPDLFTCGYSSNGDGAVTPIWCTHNGETTQIFVTLTLVKDMNCHYTFKMFFHSYTLPCTWYLEIPPLILTANWWNPTGSSPVGLYASDTVPYGSYVSISNCGATTPPTATKCVKIFLATKSGDTWTVSLSNTGCMQYDSGLPIEWTDTNNACEKVKYVWGDECSSANDCSGIVDIDIPTGPCGPSIGEPKCMYRWKALCESGSWTVTLDASTCIPYNPELTIDTWTGEGLTRYLFQWGDECDNATSCTGGNQPLPPEGECGDGGLYTGCFATCTYVHQGSAGWIGPIQSSMVTIADAAEGWDCPNPVQYYDYCTYRTYLGPNACSTYTWDYQCPNVSEVPCGEP